MKWLELKIPPLVIAFVFGVLIWIMPTPYKIDNTIFSYGASIILFSIGSIISILGVWEFKKQKTTVNPMNPQDCNSLVIKGIYKYTRNPMYLGFLFWLLSLGLFFRNPISIFIIIIFVAYMNTFQIVPEERVLQEKFGEEYLEYNKCVRRWL